MTRRIGSRGIGAKRVKVSRMREIGYTASMQESSTEKGRPSDAERSALTAVIESLSKLDNESRARLLKTVATFFAVDTRVSSGSVPVPANEVVNSQSRPRFEISSVQDYSPKEFLAEKQPETDIERVACLAFYLSHYRDMPQFKTADISRVNTEAAQVKFSNAAYAVNNASKRGFLAPAGKGTKQISSVGEAFVSALPDREAAASELSRLRRRVKKRNKKKST